MKSQHHRIELILNKPNHRKYLITYKEGQNQDQPNFIDTQFGKYRENETDGPTPTIKNSKTPCDMSSSLLETLKSDRPLCRN